MRPQPSRSVRALLWALYQAATGLALLVAGPLLLVRRGSHYLPTLPGRLGGGKAAVAGGGAGVAPGLPAGALWIHAVSVGEVGAAATLVRALPAGVPLLVTTVTPTGQARARDLFAGRAAVAYLPFDLGFAVRRFFRRFAPGALVLVEGDLWPLVLREAGRRGLPVAVVNGRVSDRSFRRMRRLRPLLGPLLSGIDRFGVQTEEDRGKLLALGVPAGRVAVTGNLKYESPAPERRPALEAEIARLAAGRPVLLAGSTMAGEEEQVLDAFARLGGGGRALLAIAPRHPERWDEVDRLLAGRGLAYVRRSRIEGSVRRMEPAAGPVPVAETTGRAADALDTAGLPAAALEIVGRPASAHEAARAPAETPAMAGGPDGVLATAGAPADGLAAAGAPADGRATAGAPADGRATAAAPAVLLLDSMGELAGLYAVAAAAFVGGTLAPTGGHNPLEPARFGVPVAVGPSMENFRDMAERFDRAVAWRRVAGPDELAAVWGRWLDDPSAAREVGRRAERLLEENRGAVARTLELLAPVLTRVAGRPAATPEVPGAPEARSA